jgi:hypothetical protein
LLAVLCAAPSFLRAEEIKDLTWSFSGEIRFRPEYRDNRDLDATVDDDLRQGFMRLRLGVGATLKDHYRVFAQVQDSRVAGEETSTASNQKNLDLHQGYVEINPGPPGHLRVIVGRQEWSYGEHRLIGNFVWDNVGRAFDGVKARYARGRFFLDALAAQVSTAVTGGASSGSELYGLYSQTTPRPGAEYEGYWLLFDDHVSAAGETGTPGTTAIHAFGARAKDRFGRFDVVGEAVWERGEFRGDDLAAHAFAAQGGAGFGTGVKVRVFAGYDFATGDRNPTDGKREEFFNFFPTNHPLYGYMDYEGWRNIKSPYAGVSLVRGRHFVQAKRHDFALDEARGPWKDAAGNVMGSDATGKSGTGVGSEIDLTYRFAWTDKAVVEGGSSEFDPGRFARRTRGDDVSRWAYLMLTFAF